MILGIGLDLVEIDRLARVLSIHGRRFEDRVFTPEESAYCATRRDRVQALAARFAAKEACLKALGSGEAEGLGLRQVEVQKEATGRPSIRLFGAAAARADAIGVRRIHVSLTHQPRTAGAFVILETGEEDHE